jgi:hypothetical protein
LWGFYPELTVFSSVNWTLQHLVATILLRIK